MLIEVKLPGILMTESDFWSSSCEVVSSSLLYKELFITSNEHPTSSI